MRINIILDKITKIIFSSKMINQILRNKIPFSIKVFAFFIHLKKRFLLWKKGEFKGLINIEGLKEYNISKENFDPKNKKDGISAMMRLKNGEEFLEKCIMSIIDFVDEIVLLVDLNSIDKTSEICKKLNNKFPEKIKYYEYSPIVYPGGNEKYSITPDDSVHSLSYFCNYCMSKVNYNYVMKFDDDMLAIDHDFKNMTSYVIKHKPDYFLALPQINISKNQKGEFAIPNKTIQASIAGLFGDHGIFPISNKTYFFNDIGCENIISPYKIKYGKTSFLHLKNLKSDGGTKNYSGYGLDYIKSLNKNATYADLPEEYKKVLKFNNIK